MVGYGAMYVAGFAVLFIDASFVALAVVRIRPGRRHAGHGQQRLGRR